MQDFNHATNPNQHAMSPEEAALIVRPAVLLRSISAVDRAMNVAYMQQPEPTVTEMFESSVATPELARIIDINQRIKDIHAQGTPVIAQPLPNEHMAEVISLADRFKQANQTAQTLNEIEDTPHAA